MDDESTAPMIRRINFILQKYGFPPNLPNVLKTILLIPHIFFWETIVFLRPRQAANVSCLENNCSLGSQNPEYTEGSVPIVYFVKKYEP